MSSNKRLHVLFSGRVQGVGFRYTVRELASGLSVTGYIRNLPDGDVELLAEDTEKHLADFLCAIRTSRVGRYITSERISWSEALGDHQSFGISF